MESCTQAILVEDCVVLDSSQSNKCFMEVNEGNSSDKSHCEEWVSESCLDHISLSDAWSDVA